MERCWQRYGGKLVGPGEKTGRKYIIKLTLFVFRFRCALSCVLAFALSLLCVALWLWSLIEDNHQLAKRQGEAGLLTNNHQLLEAEDYNHFLKSYKPAEEQARRKRRRINFVLDCKAGLSGAIHQPDSWGIFTSCQFGHKLDVPELISGDTTKNTTFWELNSSVYLVLLFDSICYCLLVYLCCTSFELRCRI